MAGKSHHYGRSHAGAHGGAPSGARQHRPNRRAQRMAGPMASLRRRWGPSVVIILLALVALMIDPGSVLYVLGAVVLAFIALSFWRRAR